MSQCENSETDDIKSWIDAQLPDMIEDLKRICRIRSVADINGTPDAAPYGQGCIDVLEEMLAIGRENGFDTHNYDNYVGRITYPGLESEEIGIWAHLDVVDEGTGWDYAPYEPQVKDGYFIARGCQDNKSSAIVGLYVLKYLKEHGIVPRHTLSLYGGTCEEAGMMDLDYFTAHYPTPALSLVPDSGFPVCCGERGSFDGELTQKTPCSGEFLSAEADYGVHTVPEKATLRLKLTPERRKCLQYPCPQEITITEEETEQGQILTVCAHGVQTQSANPRGGVNALTLLSHYVCDSGLLKGLPEEEAFRLIADINADHAGTALGVHCEDALSGPIILVATQLICREGQMVVGFASKYPVTHNHLPFAERTQTAAERYGFDLKVTRLSKANYFPPEKEVVEILTACSNEILGRADRPFIMSGGTYARKLPNAFAYGTGMPLPKAPEGLFRPGHGDYHQPDESISLERIRKGLEIYIHGILAIDPCNL